MNERDIHVFGNVCSGMLPIMIGLAWGYLFEQNIQTFTAMGDQACIQG